MQRGSAKQKLSVLGVSVDVKGWSKVRPFLEATNARYRIAVATGGIDNHFGVEALQTHVPHRQEGQYPRQVHTSLGLSGL